MWERSTRWRATCAIEKVVARVRPAWLRTILEKLAAGAVAAPERRHERAGNAPASQGRPVGPSLSTMSAGRRALLLVACVLAGIAIGYLGQMFTGSPWWFVAIPALIAVAWLAVADPERCEGGGRDRSP